ncbi:MAG: hypothetical protein U1C97_00200, partial [Candidatus Gracilibacteria bacterium]|nr:hypothetical protein [Candidatus Gracilibacteria bacterium]
MEEESDDFESPDKVPQQTDIGDPIEPPENISPQLEPISTEVGQMVTDAMSNGMDSDHFMDILAEKIKHTIISPEFALQHLERKEFQREWLKIIREEKTGDLSNWSENFRESTLVQTTLSEKFEQYEQEHDKAMHMKFSTELKEEIRLGKIPPEMAEKHLDGEAFQKEYFELILKEASPELKAELGEHEDL